MEAEFFLTVHYLKNHGGQLIEVSLLCQIQIV